MTEPNTFIPNKANYLIHLLFRNLHDDDYTVFKYASEIISLIADIDFQLLLSYNTLFQANLKLILN